jgi:hypothetical protein
LVVDLDGIRVDDGEPTIGVELVDVRGREDRAARLYRVFAGEKGWPESARQNLVES